MNIFGNVKFRLLMILSLFAMTGYPQVTQGLNVFNPHHQKLQCNLLNEPLTDEIDNRTFKSAVAGKKVHSLFGLTTQISSERGVYMLGEPVVLMLRTQNLTSSPVLIHKAFDAQEGMIWPQIAAEDGIYRTYIGPRYSPYSGKKFKKLILSNS